MIKIHYLKKERFPLKLQEAWLSAYENDFPFKYPERFIWLHVKNPYNDEDRTGVIYLTSDDEVAAWSTVIHHKIKIGNSVVQGGAAADTYTVPRFRRMGFWILLQKDMIEGNDIYWSVEMSAANRQIRIDSGLYLQGQPLNFFLKITRLLDKARFKESARQWCDTRNTWAANLTKSEPFLTLLYWFVNMILKRGRVVSKDPLLSFEAIDQFDDEINVLWSEICSGADFTNYRDSVYLNWRYCDLPSLKYHKFKIFFKHGLAGILVFRIGSEMQRHEAYITELMLKPGLEFTIPEVLGFCENIIKVHDGRLIFIATSQTSFLNSLSTSGYLMYDSAVPFWTIKSSIKGKIDYEKALASDSRWLMSLGDQDMDQANNHIRQPDFSILLKITKEYLLRKLRSIPLFLFRRNN